MLSFRTFVCDCLGGGDALVSLESDAFQQTTIHQQCQESESLKQQLAGESTTDVRKEENTTKVIL